ncbi:penicillin-binding transpeptidase domain-containing protein [Vampirovibrio sp.]|uniref:penicillin-binding transpeptidase domain-containing protein n=1 Tax=Vampirovibrio sp. TaxID=2717857 RepID=UPI00359455B5
MHDYFSGSNHLSRREFLKALAAASGALLLPSFFSNDWLQTALAQLPTPPFWWSSLRDGHIYGPEQAHACFGLPGSLMKLVAASALLEEGLISPHQVLECRGTWVLKGKRYHCQQAHGKLTMAQALGVSCSIYFAQAAEVLSSHRFLQYAEAFQLNRPTRSGDGYLFPTQSAFRYSSQRLVLGLSTAMQPSAAQLLRMTRHIAKRDIAGFRPQTWQVLQTGMRLAATRGTAHNLDPANRLHIAAKTGTAPSGGTYQSWVVGYFPVENPKYVFCARALNGTAKDVVIPTASRYLLSHSWA